MTFDELWRKICDKNPQIVKGDGTVRLTIENFNKALALAYSQGRRQERIMAHKPPAAESAAEAVKGFFGL